MPNLKTSIKDLRQSKKRREYNRARRSSLRNAEHDMRKYIREEDQAAAEKSLPRLYKVIDKAAKTGVIKIQTAARKKSRLSRKVNSLSAPDVKASKKTS
ncbi:30S ribosomal protein S20 [Candidatus Dojkabacteria bacterium]|uniref:Small ribosomal subunit protein bS20 n=1 Tax=Candidatus Dojkabacteria bacterium TaxID=2099670 RepID=A0A955HX72_9BACT|nr:30S ribosomal protein S20 [Candidatus Dojkabacteria bacterium]MCB9790906.1 30S ribosomal protein S20 [Candidatus Nomurabacteria bacterium]